MAVALYMDVHIPRAITIGLRLRGVDVITAQEDSSATLPDALLLDRALVLGRVLFTFDDDLLAEATHRQQESIPFAGVIYTRFLSVSTGPCINDLEILAKAGDLEDFANQVEYLPM